ncbi:MAG: hypothetical protein AAB778_03555 [Patescibacteria group bacterium]
MDNKLIQILSDLFVNLSAGWFGAALIIPISSKDDEGFEWFSLIINLILGLLSLIVGYYIISY